MSLGHVGMGSPKGRELSRITSGLLVCTTEWMLSVTEMANTERGPDLEGSEEGMLMSLVLPFLS